MRQLIPDDNDSPSRVRRSIPVLVLALVREHKMLWLISGKQVNPDATGCKVPRQHSSGRNRGAALRSKQRRFHCFQEDSMSQLPFRLVPWLTGLDPSHS